MQTGFTDREVELMWTEARTEREVAVKTFEKHENKMNADKQSRKLLWEWLDSQVEDGNLDLEVDHTQIDRGESMRSERHVLHAVAENIVQYNIEFNDFKVPMDLKRRAIQYLAYRGFSARQITNYIL